MFLFRRGRFPFLPIVFLLAVVGVALIGPAGAALGFLLFLPIKFLLFMFFFGMLFRSAPGGGPWGSRGQGGRWAPPREPTREERERAEALRLAKEEVDRLFPDL